MSVSDPAPRSAPDRVVPPNGMTAGLTLFVSAAMAFLAVFALALMLSTDRLADRWESELSRTSTIRIAAPPEQVAAQVEIVLEVLAQTPGVASARALSDDDQRALLAPWFGVDLPLEDLPIPQLIEVVEAPEGLDATGLRLRLQAQAPGAVFDDHTRWRRPLAEAAGRLRSLGLLAMVLIGAATAAMITLGASAALAANAQIIHVLRRIGARDTFIVRAFVRRFTLRALLGAAAGTAFAMGAIAALPPAASEASFLTGLGFRGLQWLWPLTVPLLAALIAFLATRLAAFRAVREVI